MTISGDRAIPGQIDPLPFVYFYSARRFKRRTFFKSVASRKNTKQPNAVKTNKA